MLGESLRLIRVFHDCNAAQLAKELGLSRSLISQIENKKPPSMKTLKKYADYFDISVSSIIVFAKSIKGEKNSNSKEATRKKLIKFMQIIKKVQRSELDRVRRKRGMAKEKQGQVNEHPQI